MVEFPNKQPPPNNFPNFNPKSKEILPYSRPPPQFNQVSLTLPQQMTNLQGLPK